MAFFLEWLETWARLSLVEGATVDYDFERRGFHPRVKANMRDFFDVPSARVFRRMAEFLRVYFPDDAIDAGSIKVRLWRFRKSGVIERIEKERAVAYARRLTPEQKKRQTKTWQALRRRKVGKIKRPNPPGFEDAVMKALLFEWQPKRIRDKFRPVARFVEEGKGE